MLKINFYILIRPLGYRVSSLDRILELSNELRNIGLCSDEKSDCKISEAVSYPGYTSTRYQTLFVDNGPVLFSLDKSVITKALDKLKIAGICK